MTLDDLKKIEAKARVSDGQANQHANAADQVAAFRANGVHADISLSDARFKLLRHQPEKSPLVQAYENAETALREELLAIVEADLRGKARVLRLQARAAWLELGFYVEPQEPKE